MFARTLALFTFGVAAILFGASHSEAQPGKGDKDPGKEKQEDGLEGKGKKDFNKDDFKKKFEAMKDKKGFDKDDFKKKIDAWKEMAKNKGPGGFGPRGFEGKGPGAKLDRATITAKYEFYKKLYDNLPRDKGKGYEAKRKGGYGNRPDAKRKGGSGKRPDASSSRSVEARIDRLIRELEEIRSEVRRKR